jgi:hypothetical protein
MEYLRVTNGADTMQDTPYRFGARELDDLILLLTLRG